MIVSTAVREALAHDSVPPPLKPYTENQHPYHPFTGPGCTGLSDDTDSALEDYGAHSLIDHPLSACNSATPRGDVFSEESSFLLQTICARGRASHAFREAQAANAGNRTLSQLPTVTTPVSDEDTFQDAEEENL